MCLRSLKDKIEAKRVLVCSTRAMEKNIDIVIERRFKKHGMSWTTKGANNLLKLRILCYTKNYGGILDKRVKLWGGLFPLGHTAFFGIGGYTAGLLMVRLHITSFWLLAPAGIVVAGITGGLFAIIALRSKGLLFSIITMAECQLLVTAATRWTDVTGGDNGLIGIPKPDLNIFGLNNLNQTSFYILVLIVTLICYFLMYRIIKSPFGLALQGNRDDEGRLAHLGYNTWLFKFIAFIIAGGFAGIAGVLFASVNGVMVPAHMGVVTSVLAVLMIIMGGNRIIFGPVLGAVVVAGLENVVSLYTPQRWPLILGCIFVVTVMFLRGGLTPYLIKLWGRINLGHGSNKA